METGKRGYVEYNYPKSLDGASMTTAATQEGKTRQKNMEEYQIFSSPQVRSRDWPQQIWAASFFFCTPSQIYSSIHCLVDVSSETLDLCVLLPYSSKFNLFPLFCLALHSPKFVFFPIRLSYTMMRYGTRSSEMHSLIFYCFPTHLFPADAYDYSYSDAACMHVCAHWPFLSSLFGALLHQRTHIKIV